MLRGDTPNRKKQNHTGVAGSLHFRSSILTEDPGLLDLNGQQVLGKQLLFLAQLGKRISLSAHVPRT